MKYCSNCGKELPLGVKFCPDCGASTNLNESQLSSKREEVFAGKVVKCPNCGTEIPNSYTTHCPACGYELKMTKSYTSLNEFKEKMNEYDKMLNNCYGGYNSWSTGKKIGWVILCIYTVGICYLVYSSKHKKDFEKIKAIKKEKENLVENYTWPNDRDNLLDGLIYVKERLSSLSANKVKGENYTWAKIWRNKAEHLYSKIQTLYPNDTIALDTYNQAIGYFDKIKKEKMIRTIITTAIIVITFIVYYFTVYLPSGGTPISLTGTH